MFPVNVYQEGMELPSDGNYFVVAGNGIFLHKDAGLFKGFVRVENISSLDDMTIGETATTSLPKIPHTLVMQVKKFFAQVFACHHAEACIILHYSEGEAKYKIIVPEQQVSHVAVMYKRMLPEDGYRSVGTIHSHCDFNASHSSTDDADEEHFDGLHITFGHVNSNIDMSCSASIVLNGQRTMIDPLSILAGVIGYGAGRYCIAPHPLDEDVDYEVLQKEVNSWMERVNRQ